MFVFRAALCLLCTRPCPGRRRRRPCSRMPQERYAGPPREGRAWSAPKARTSRPTAETRRAQPTADAQPLSMIRKTGPEPPSELPETITGPERPTIKAAAVKRRSRMSQRGDDRGVCRSLVRPKIRRIAGNRMLFGAGGVIRKSHQINGKANSPTRTHGVEKARGPRLGIAYIPFSGESAR